MPVGAQFGVVLVLIDDEPFEVATFRRDGTYLDGRHPSEVHFGSLAEDVQRRDFTINGMVYDPIDDRVIDLVEGQKDLRRRRVRAIGNPQPALPKIACACCAPSVLRRGWNSPSKVRP